MTQVHTEPKAGLPTRTKKADQIFQTKRVLVVESRTPLQTLIALRAAWLDDDLDLHVAVSGQLLGQLAMRPWFAASTMLDATVRVTQRFGMDGIVPVALTCLSSAYVLTPAEAGKAADEFALALAHPRDHLKLQRNGFHLFLDLEQMAGEAVKRLIATAILNQSSNRPWAIDGRPDPLGGAGLGGVAGLVAGLQSKGALFTTAMLSAMRGDKPHDQLMAFFHHKPQSNQALPGFGPMVRQATQGDPAFEWKEQGVGHVSAGSKGFRIIYNTESGRPLLTNKSQAELDKPDKVKGNVSVVHFIYPTDKDGNRVEGPPEPPTGTDKYPLPDDVGGDDFPAVLSDFASKGLLPWTQPIDGEVGDGPAILHYSNPSVTNPGSEAASTRPLTDDEVEKMLRFIQATLFDAYVNPVPFHESLADGTVGRRDF